MYKITVKVEYFMQVVSNNDLRMITDTAVRFSAHTVDSKHCRDGLTIEFPSALTNEGDAFDPVTSRFTCPTTAFYYLYFNLFISMDPLFRECDVEMRVDDVPVVMVSYHFSDVTTICFSLIKLI